MLKSFCSRLIALNSIAACCIVLSNNIAFAEVVKIAQLEPLSGPYTAGGQTISKQFRAIADLANQEKWAGDTTFEVVGFDNKGSPQEALTQLKTAID